MEALIIDLNKCYGWELAPGLSYEQLEEWLAEKLNGWIVADFPALLQFLYRIDVSESRLQLFFKENPHEDAGKALARFVLERQMQKMQTRRQFKPGDAESDEERW